MLKHNLYVLADEAYFDMRYAGKSKSFVEQPGMAERTVVLYTFSKKFAMTGWRLGASVGPKEIVDVIAKINVNDESCSNHFIQYGALAGLEGDQTEVQAILDTLHARRDAAVDALNAIDGIHTFRPKATFYLLPNVTEVMERKGMTDYEVFRRAALHATGVSFTPTTFMVTVAVLRLCVPVPAAMPWQQCWTTSTASKVGQANAKSLRRGPSWRLSRSRGWVHTMAGLPGRVTWPRPAACNGMACPWTI